MNRKKKIALLSFSIKLLILLITLGYIYKQIFYKSGIEEIRQTYQNSINGQYGLFILFIVIALMLVNWGLEAYKWRLMIARIENISYIKSLKAIFSGVTISLFTPNRVGEYGGRVFYLHPDHRIQAVFITILSSMSQLLITIITGMLALVYFLPKLTIINDYLYYTIIVITCALLLLLLFFYFNIYLMNIFLLKIRWLWKAEKYMHVLMSYSFTELLKVFLLSLIRFSVFTIQFYLLLILFKVNIPLFEGIMVISLSFFIVSAIPTFTLSELGIRGSVSVYFIGILSSNAIGILTSSFTLWLINLVIPALFGALLIFKLRLFKQK